MPQLRTTLESALRAAGRLIKQSLRTNQVYHHKGAIDLVTATDREAEELALATIREDYPDAVFLAEESFPHERAPSKWIIDPLDGTTNFAHGFPVACTSIAYEEKGVVHIGGVYDPFRDELFLAETGGGATCNGTPIHVSTMQTLAQSLLVTGFPYDRRTLACEYLKLYQAFMERTQGVRRTGSAAFDLCQVACGRFDGFWELKLHPWDMAAGYLMIQEAGGTVTTFSGQPFTVYGQEILASNGRIHMEMLDVLKQTPINYG